MSFGEFDSPIIEQRGFFSGFENEANKNAVLTKAFSWMFWGLGISAVAALLFSQLVVQNEKLIVALIPLAIVEFIMVLVLSLKVSTMSVTTAKVCFIAYAIINGLTLSTIFLYYSIGSIYTTFFITASIFAVAAIYGKVTKKDLSGMGTYLIMGLWGIIIAGIVNIFIRNSMLEFITSLVAIALFIGLTAYDVNKIKNYSSEFGIDSDEQKEKVAIMGALTLYLDIINLFIRLLQFFGKRKD